MTPDVQELLGQSVGPYVLDRLIGHGGFAWVFEAHDPASNGKVALKLLKFRYAGDPQFEERFRSEYQLASQLEHPNLVKIIDVGHSGRFTYFAMSLYPDSLSSLIERGGPLDERRLVTIALDVARGLSFAHDQGIVHRDIKGDNILIDRGGKAVIADFGTARAVSKYVTATGVNMTIGTPQYISPEQAQGRGVDGRSDLYSLGITLYKAATGDVPFRSNDWFELARMHVEEKPDPVHKKRPGISHRLERIVLKCLAKHPDDRYPSAARLQQELEQIAADDRDTTTFGPAPATTAELEVETDTGSHRKWLLRMGALALIVLVAALVVILGR